MTLHKHLVTTLLLTMSTAHALSPPLQDPLMQPPSHETPSSRRIVVRQSSQSVSGSYPLYDLLSIFTQSGSISVSVTPHSASPDDPNQPASLQIRSNSGSVNVDLSEALVALPASAANAPSDCDPDAPPPYSREAPSHSPVEYGAPKRRYLTSVTTTAGSISGTFPLGARTSLNSRSGSLNGVELVVMPANGSEPRHVSTVSRDGSQSIRIVEDFFWEAGTKRKWWEGMEARHDSYSGSITVDYPDSWEGRIEVETQSGSVSIRGRGVEVIQEGRRWIAKKGTGDGRVLVKARSGRVDLTFG